jgi:hypothetical protein
MKPKKVTNMKGMDPRETKEMAEKGKTTKLMAKRERTREPMEPMENASKRENQIHALA